MGKNKRRAQGHEPHIPGIDDGFWFLSPPQPDIAPSFGPPAKISALIATEHPEQAMALHRMMSRERTEKSGTQSVIFASYPALIEQYSFEGGAQFAKGKQILTGAGELRFRNKLRKGKNGENRLKKLVAQYTAHQSQNDANIETVDLEANPEIRDLPFVIDTRNYWNFYHFTTESLLYLCLYRNYALTGPIYFVTPNKAPLAKFVSAEISATFPELSDRVQFKRGRLSLDRAIIPFSTRQLFNACSEAVMPSFTAEAGLAKGFGSKAPDEANLDVIRSNSRDRCIGQLRDTMLSKISGRSRGFKRIYVGRKTGKSREMENAAGLQEVLNRHEFETVYFEDFSPVEQAELVHSADIMIADHGAGFTNMLYARPGAHMIELSHLQTARHRYGDFNMHAQASQSYYTHFFADHAGVPPGKVPSMNRDGHKGIKMTPKSLHILDAYLNMLVNDAHYKRTSVRIYQCLRRGDLEEGLKLRDAVLCYAPAAPGLSGDLATICGEAGHYDLAIAHALDALTLAPFRPGLYRITLKWMAAAGRSKRERMQFFDRFGQAMPRQAARTNLIGDLQ